MTSCPRCPDEPLIAQQVAARPAQLCSTCGGQAVGIAVFRQSVEKRLFRDVMAALRAATGASALACPSCRSAMAALVIATDEVEPEAHRETIAHGCLRCQVLWFDEGTRPAPIPAPEKATVLPPEVQRAFAEAYVEADNERQKRRDRADKLRNAPFAVLKRWLIPGWTDLLD